MKSIRIQKISGAYFPRIRTEYGEIRSKPYVGQMPENTDHRNFKYGRFPRSEHFFSRNTDRKLTEQSHIQNRVKNLTSGFQPLAIFTKSSI